jgi:phosphonoacetate hydrolase
MGSDYVEAALEGGLWPRVHEWLAEGLYAVGDGILPSFTNPNNLSIVTGLSTRDHGICGNHFFDRALGREVPLEDPAYLRAETRLAALERRGARVAAVTAKEKLRRLLGAGRSGPSFSAERADALGDPAWGIERLDRFVGEPAPPMYSAAASTFVLRAGIALLVRARPDLLYLSTTDYLQHRYGPGAPELDGFLREVDRCLGALADLGAVVAVTADHGMSAKPRVVYLGERLPGARVTLPITDPYIRHHGALGGCAFVDTPDIAGALERLGDTPGIEVALPRAEAAARFELPEDRVGDVVVLATADAALGRTPAEHDLASLEGPLRSHGGPAEARVPLLVSARVPQAPTTSRALLDTALAAAGWARTLD